MKIGYKIIKIWLRTGLFFYYRKIKVIGRENIPKDKPIMLLANHQNALMDALVIVMNCGMKPYFLARSDLFKNPIVSRLLHYLQMMPIYRFRDGIDTLRNNPAIFEKCGNLLEQGETIMLFPEGNHGIERKVRLPMRKGFARMIFSALEKNPDLDIRILPVGLNYINADKFPDSVALHIGKDFAVQDYFDPHNLEATETKLKEIVFENLKILTTHIPEENNYANVQAQLEGLKVDYLDPTVVNRTIENVDPAILVETKKHKTSLFFKLVQWVFNMINFPIILLWNKVVKPLDMDIEFRATLRFMLGLILFPVFYVLIYAILFYKLGQEIALTVILAHVIFNLAFVKLR